MQYTCFVEGCERKCLTHQKRRLHLIDKHMYPKNFFFGITKEGIDGRRSLLNDGAHHRRRSSTNTQSKESRRRTSLLEATSLSPSKAKTQAETTSLPPPNQPPSANTPRHAETSPAGAPAGGESVDMDMAELTGAMSSLQFVPPSIRFGRGTRAGFSKK